MIHIANISRVCTTVVKYVANVNECILVFTEILTCVAPAELAMLLISFFMTC